MALSSKRQLRQALSNPNASTDTLRSVVEALWDEIVEINKVLTISNNTVTLHSDDALALRTQGVSVEMFKDGSIKISGENVYITGVDRVTVKASRDVIIKGSKILQN